MIVGDMQRAVGGLTRFRKQNGRRVNLVTHHLVDPQEVPTD
jgi:hypothetical protein